MAFFIRNRFIFFTLAAVMAATRLHHFDVLPDASWAVLFLGGFYLRSPLAFLGLMLEAVAIDYIATQHLGVSSYCLSPAYTMLLPAYAALWFGGALAKRLWETHSFGVIVFTGCLIASVSFCFLLTNASFYWLSGRVSSPNLEGWLINFRHWYPSFALVACAYVGAAEFAHMGIRRLRGIMHVAGSRATTRAIYHEKAK